MSPRFQGRVARQARHGPRRRSCLWAYCGFGLWACTASGVIATKQDCSQSKLRHMVFVVLNAISSNTNAEPGAVVTRWKSGKVYIPYNNSIVRGYNSQQNQRVVDEIVELVVSDPVATRYRFRIRRPMMLDLLLGGGPCPVCSFGCRCRFTSHAQSTTPLHLHA